MEVVIALGVISFAIIGILSILTTALHEGREASDDTMLVAMVNRMITELRATPFSELSNGNNGYYKVYYFDSDGLPVSSKDTALYGCTVVLAAPDAETKKVTGDNYKLVQLQFASPVQAANPPKRILNATVSNFNQ